MYKKLNLPKSLIETLQNATLEEMASLNLLSVQIHFLAKPINILNNYFVKNNIDIPSIRSCMLFHRPGNFPQPLHFDCNNDNPPQPVNCGINIPIKNCEDSYMEWYSGNYTTRVNAVTGPDNIVRTYIDLDWKESPKLVERTIIDAPTLVKVNVPHKVTVTNKIRSLITLRFQNNPTFEDIRKLFS